MAGVNTQSSYHGRPPKRRARIDSYLEESLSSEGSKSGNTQEEEEEEEGEEEEDNDYNNEVEKEEDEGIEEDEGEDASPSLSSSTHQGSLSTSQDHYYHLLATTGGPNCKPMISVCDRDAILALAAARDPSTIGQLLQQKYDVAWARLQRNGRIINFEDDYQRVGGLISSLPQDLGSFDPGTQMRQTCTTIDQIFDSILRQVDDESQLETKMSAARTMQRILRRLLIYSIESGNMIPEEFSSDGQGRLGLDGVHADQ